MAGAKVSGLAFCLPCLSNQTSQVGNLQLGLFRDRILSEKAKGKASPLTPDDSPCRREMHAEARHGEPNSIGNANLLDLTPFLDPRTADYFRVCVVLQQ